MTLLLPLFHLLLLLLLKLLQLFTESRLQSCSSDINLGDTDGNVSTQELDVDDAGNQHGYVLMDTEILSSLLVELVKCPRCGFYVQTEHLVDSKQGLSNLFKISCRNISCRWDKTFFTSKQARKDGRGSRPFDVNLRSIIAFREWERDMPDLKRFADT